MKRFLVVLNAMILCAAAFALDATVVSVSGRVEVQENGSWFPLSKGDKVEKGAVISTGFKSEAVFEIKGTKFTLGPLTRMTVQKLVEGDNMDTTELFIDSGKVAASVNPVDGKRMGFKVRSPIATASVRGTEFSFSADGRLSVDRGVVGFGATSSNESVAESDNGIPVAAGQESQTDAATGACSSPAQEKATAASGAASSTVSMTQNESVAVASAVSTALSAGPAVSASGSSTNSATINVTLEF